jgi:hypothetical protein
MSLPAQSVVDVDDNNTTVNVEVIVELPLFEIQKNIDIENKHQLYLGSSAYVAEDVQLTESR